MRFEELAEASTQSAGAVAMDDADARSLGQSGFVEKFIDALGSLFHCGTDDIDFIGASGLVPGGAHGDSAARDGGLRRRLLKPNDFIRGDFHAQRAGFNFGGSAIEAAEDDRFAEAANAYASAGLKRPGVNGSGLRGSTEIALRV